MTDFRFYPALYAGRAARLEPQPTVPVLHETPFGWHAYADRSELDDSLELAPFQRVDCSPAKPRVAVYERGTKALGEAYHALSYLAHMWRTRAAHAKKVSP